MEENILNKETRRHKFSGARKGLMIAGWILCAAMLAAGIVFVIGVVRLNVLTTPAIAVIIAVLAAVTALFAFLQRWITSGIITKLLAIILSVVMVIGSSYLGTTNKALEKMSGITTQIDNVQVYVLKDSSYDSVNDLKEARYGIAETLDRDNTDKAIDMIVTETGASISPYEYTGVMQLIDALYDDEVDAVILNSSFLSILEDLDNYTDIEDRIRSVWSADIETVIDDNKESGTNNGDDNTEDPDKDPYEEYEDYLYGGEDVFTLYISGIDTTGSPMVNRNSDVNILMTVNTKTRQILMINTPRDFYVPLSISNGVKDKLTHAGCYGIQVSVDTLEMLYGVNIDDYVKVNFTGFVDVIDLLGGVTVYSEYEFSSSGYHYTQGYNSLNGAEALIFARERHAFGSGDRQRGKNQMAVIQGIINKITSTDALLNYNSIIEAVSSSIATSMSTDEITDLIKMQLSDMRGWDIVTYSVDGTGDNLMTFSLTAPNYVMVPTQSTVDQAKEYLRQIYAGETIIK